MKLADIRKCFLEYFKNRDHKIIQSSSLIPHNDNSLMFTNSGMVQFKDVFLGLETKDYCKASTVQKCLRAGGKHNDLDNVGFTARHHTFFEMLGNFSFGDYFKEEAILYSWNFLTKVIGIPKEKLIVTVFHEDEDAQRFWNKISPSTQVIPISTSDNFWSIGDVGPCGPCSEIFYNHTNNTSAITAKDLDGDNFIEIWNIVFMQFFQNYNNPLVALEKKSIDTGMGLERLAAVLQGVTDNYDIDAMQAIISATQSEISLKCTTNNKSSFKVIADHIRSISFLIADGVIPSNEGAGYVLRRILRRAVRHYHMLGYHDTCLHKIIPVLVDDMKGQYPELHTNLDNILSTTKSEEEKFLTTIDRGIKLLDEEVKKLESTLFPGDIAFKLYDTYGFPLDLTQDILKNKNINVDIEKFQEALNEQKNRGGFSSANGFNDNTLLHSLKEKTSKTLPSGTEFIGYNKLSDTARIHAIIIDNTLVESVSDEHINNIENCETKNFENCDDKKITIILDKSCFYAESGGQSGDVGTLTNSINNTVFQVTDCQQIGENLFGVIGYISSGAFSVNTIVNMNVNKENRKRICCNHTSAHLLQAALKKVINKNISQRGSMVNANILRFDFNYNNALTKEELQKIENQINTWIRQSHAVNTSVISKDQAVTEGALALFGEKYSDLVRVVSIGNQEIVSKELCGGTHVTTLGEIGMFKIISEGSIGSGLRRIEAITAETCYQTFKHFSEQIKTLEQLLNIDNTNLIERIKGLLEENKTLHKQLTLVNLDKIISNNTKTQTIKSTTFKYVKCNDFPPDGLKILADKLTTNALNTITVIINETKENIAIIVLSTTNEIKANELLKQMLSTIQGNGGGRTDFAQGGGKITCEKYRNIDFEDIVVKFLTNAL